MSIFGALIAGILSSFLIGCAGRFAIPGPDPMPFWFTVAVGFGGSAGGGAIAAALFGAHDLFSTRSHAFWTILLEIGVAAALVAAYRIWYQRRPLTGADAYRFPSRGVGIGRMRARLRKMGIDPDRLTGRSSAAPSQRDAAEVAAELERLRARRDAGELTDEEYEAERERLKRF